MCGAFSAAAVFVLVLGAGFQLAYCGESSLEGGDTATYSRSARRIGHFESRCVARFGRLFLNGEFARDQPSACARSRLSSCRRIDQFCTFESINNQEPARVVPTSTIPRPTCHCAVAPYQISTPAIINNRSNDSISRAIQRTSADNPLGLLHVYVVL